MIENGENIVVCSHCGCKFWINKLDTSINPNKCPSCEYIIIKLIVPNDGSRIVAIV